MAGQEKEIAFTDEILKDSRKLEEANSEVNRIAEQIRRGYGVRNVSVDQKYGQLREFLFSVAMSRIKAEGRFSRYDRIWLDEYSASYSTPEIVGKYRAGRIRSRKILDLGAGACMQAIMFAVHNEVVAIEEDPLRANLGRLNSIAYGSSSLKIINAEVMNYISTNLRDGVTIFMDPLRLSGRGEKSFETLKPNPLPIIEAIGSNGGGYVLDLPPLFPEKNLQMGGEKEYISLNGRINRFTLYSADLSKCERSAVILPAERRIEGTADQLSYDHAEKPGRFLVMPDPALLMAKLVNSSFDPSVFKLFEKDERRLILTSDIMPKVPGTCETFELISFSTASGIRDELVTLKPGKVIPRFSLNPDQYYEYARSLVDPLWVGESVYLFKSGDSIALARKIN